MKTIMAELEGICPTCGKRFDTATQVEGQSGPAPKDWTLCLYCGEILRFDAELHPAALTAADAHELEADWGLSNKLRKLQQRLRAEVVRA